MARVNTGNTNGHSHSYTDVVSSSGRAKRTSIDAGHDHPVVRDDAGRAIRIGRADGHTHPLKV